MMACVPGAPNDYSHLIRACERLDNHKLECLKQHFAYVILSQRSLSRIRDVGNLICILEKREADNNVFNTYLEKIAEIVGLHENERQLLTQDVKLYIASEIGNKWRELARNLRIKESDIELIEAQHSQNIHNATFEVLKKYEQHSDQSSAVQKLITALKASRRRDMAAKVQELVDATSERSN